MKEVKLEELEFNPFTMIGKEWMLINTKTENEVNTMTASWGGMGHLWNKNVVFLFIRPQRYTKKLIDEDDVKISVSFFGGEHKKELGYLGTNSTYDVKDKIQKSGLHLIEEDGVVSFEEATLTLEVEKLYRQTLTEDSFLNKKVDEDAYPKHDYHDVYVCEIKRVFRK